MNQYITLNDPEIDDRINSGIENNRKGFGSITLEDWDGNPVKKASVRFKLIKHEFHFGCNAFMLNQFPEAEKNAGYEDLFSDLFNLAVVPFYWSDLEPEDGKLRFEANSKPIYRRPPPDMVLDFCEKNNIVPKGHPLLWHCFRPEWVSHDPLEMTRRIEQRFCEISERYRDRIKIWDVCNEAQTMPVDVLSRDMPEEHVELAFQLAEKYFPNSVRAYNDDRRWYLYSYTYSPVYLLMKNLLDKGYKVNALGLQFHMFDNLLKDSHRFLNPRYLFKCLDLYGKLNVPINFSEVSIISRRDLGNGDEFQRTVVERLYKLWFSHAAVNGIIWWNLVDGTSAYAPLGSEKGENRLRAGLVNYDLTPKPAYKTISNLINKEWQTDVTIDYDENAVNKFKGFYGEYEVTIDTEKGSNTKTLILSKDSLNIFHLKV